MTIEKQLRDQTLQTCPFRKEAICSHVGHCFPDCNEIKIWKEANRFSKDRVINDLMHRIASSDSQNISVHKASSWVLEAKEIIKK